MRGWVLVHLRACVCVCVVACECPVVYLRLSQGAL